MTTDSIKTWLAANSTAAIAAAVGFVAGALLF